MLDATGRRIGRRVDGAIVQGFTYLDPLRPGAELDGKGAFMARFLYGLATSTPTYVVRDGKTLLLVVVDDVGTPRLLVDAADGSVVGQLETDAHGRTITDKAGGMLPFGFAGGIAISRHRAAAFRCPGLRPVGRPRDGAGPARRRWPRPQPVPLRRGRPGEPIRSDGPVLRRPRGRSVGQRRWRWGRRLDRNEQPSCRETPDAAPSVAP